MSWRPCTVFEDTLWLCLPNIQYDFLKSWLWVQDFWPGTSHKATGILYYLFSEQWNCLFLTTLNSEDKYHIRHLRAFWLYTHLLWVGFITTDWIQIYWRGKLLFWESTLLVRKTFLKKFNNKHKLNLANLP